MTNRAFLLFTRQDLGPGFDEDVFTDLVAQLMAKNATIPPVGDHGPEHMLLGLGLPPNQYTNGALKKLVGPYPFVYVLTQAQYICLEGIFYTIERMQHGPVANTIPDEAAAVAAEAALSMPTAEELHAAAEAKLPDLPNAMTPADDDAKYGCLMLADMLRYNQKTPVLNDTQRGSMLGKIEGNLKAENNKWFGDALDGVQKLELATTAPQRAEVVRHLFGVTQQMFTHCLTAPDNWRATLAPRIEQARTRSDDEAVKFFHAAQLEILMFHFLPPDKPRNPHSLYVLKFGERE